MIAYIQGEVVARASDHVIVDVRGVGYKVFVPRHPQGDAVILNTHHVVRDDAQQLYGFETREELDDVQKVHANFDIPLEVLQHA